MEVTHVLKLPPNFDRKDWPLKDMEVGQIVCISNPPAHAQVYVHVYASKLNKKFRTKTVDGALFVTRKL